MASPTRSYPQIFNRMGFQVFHFIGIPLSMIAFILIYNPFNLQEVLTYPKAGFPFNITIILAITTGCYLICRLIFYFTRSYRESSWLQYFAWVVLEVLVSSCFIAMYLTLMKGRGVSYFTVLIDTLARFIGIAIFPYAIITMFFTLIGQKEEAASYKDNSQERVKFYDSSHNLKLIVAAPDLLYIEAQDNYICIHYTEKGALKQYVLRSSMAAIEDLCRGAGLLRCHRSYFVKVSRIHVLSKDKEGMIFAQMDDLNATRVPVTKRYYDTLSSLL